MTAMQSSKQKQKHFLFAAKSPNSSFDLHWREA